MFRLIRYHGTIAKDDKGEFSTCSTDYTVYGLYSADCVPADVLTAFAKVSGIETTGAPFTVDKRGYREISIVCALKLTNTIPARSSWGREEEPHAEYIGLVDLSRFETGTLKPIGIVDGIDCTDKEQRLLDCKRCESDEGAAVTKAMADNIVCYGEYDTSNVGEQYSGGTVLVKESWFNYHAFPLLGYSRSSFLNALGVTDEGFSDDTYSCDGCGILDHADNGYTYNHRVVNECEQLGVRCGCFEKHCLSDEAIDEYADQPRKAMELETVEKLEERGKVRFIERYIGGMVDGRGGSYGGESCNEGTPSDVLTALKKKHPTRRYLFSHDESGQFQTYFSVWRVASPGKRFKGEKK